MRESRVRGRDMCQRDGWISRAVLGAALVISVALGIVAGQEPKKAEAVKPAQAAPQKVEAKPVPVAVPAPVQMKFQVGGAIVMGQPVGQPGQENQASNERIKLPVDLTARRKITDAQRFIELQDWQSAVRVLQMLLDSSEDNFLQESENDKGRRVSIRAEANRILGSLPREGRLFYEQQFGAQAKVALRQAKSNGNPQALAEVALKYVHTEAGAEAAALLGSYHLDHGRYIVAALCYERLMARDESMANLPAATLLKAATAFERSGDSANRDKAWSAFQTKLNQGREKLPALLRSWDETKFKAALARRTDGRPDQLRSDWPLFMGSPDRTARSYGSGPFLEPKFAPYEPVVEGQARKEIEYASRKLTSLGFPIIPGTHPIVVRDLAIFRALDGIHAVNLKTGQMEWNSTSDASLANMLRSQASSGDPEGVSRIYQYRDTAPQVITENTLLGTLSADQELVYAVEDLAIPAFTPNYGNPWMVNRQMTPRIGDKLTDYTSCNHLTAYDIEGGRAVWSIGTKEPEQPFTDMYFLGPPLPLGDKLYVLAEANAEIKLLCLQLRRSVRTNGRNSDYQYGVDLMWAQPLGVVDRRITEDPVRRSQAALLSYSDGILVCPTNAGSIIGVDLLTRSLVWAYSYQSEPNAVPDEAAIFLGGGRVRGWRGGGQPEALFGNMNWSFCAPIISGGKVLIASPDGKNLQAVNLRDGTVAWSLNRAEAGKPNSPADHYLAGVFDGKVVLVGKQSTRAVELSSGKQLWRTTTNMPQGRGVANESTFFLPVQPNEVVAISLKDGQIIGKSKALHKEQIGNLVLVGEDLISVNLTHLMVYPQQEVKERQVAERLKKDGNDPIGRLDRGELRRHRGDLAGALDDFKTALAHQPIPITKEKAEIRLFDVSCELLSKDFNRHEELIKTCEQLLGQQTEGKPDRLERESRLLRVLANGREKQGRIMDALAAYQKYAKLDTKLVPSPEDPETKVIPWVWARTQAEAMAKRLAPGQRLQLQEAVRAAWEKAEQEKSLEAMERFVDFYGDLAVIGQEAHLLYADRLIENRDYPSAQVRLLPLMESSEATVSAKAMDGLARLNMKLGELENAVYYYRLLSTRHPQVVVREGKTGARLLKELMNDKRFLPYLDVQSGFAALKDVSLERDGSSSSNSSTFLMNFTASRPAPPGLKRFSLQIDSASNNNYCNYIVRDRATKEVVVQNMANTLPMINFGYYQQLADYQYQMCGDVMVFAWGDKVIAVNPMKRKEVWSINLLNLHGESRNQQPGLGQTQLMPHRSMPGRFEIFHSSGIAETLGTVGCGSSQRVVITLKDVGLVGLDPATGTQVWVRSGVSTNTEMFGDGEYVIVTPPQAAQNVNGNMNIVFRVNQMGVPMQTKAEAEFRPIAVRLLDGQAIELDEQFMTQYKNRHHRWGRHLLVREEAEGQFEKWSLIDPVRQKAVWTKLTAKDALLLRPGSTDEMVGFFQTTGAMEILDLPTGKLLSQATISFKKEFANLKQGHLVADHQHYYLFFCEGMSEKVDEDTNRQLVTNYSWLRSIPVNGPAFALDRTSGEVVWQEKLPLQSLIVHRFEDMPVLVCAGVLMENKVPKGVIPAAPNIQVLQRRGGFNNMKGEIKIFAKQTGKALPLAGGETSIDMFTSRRGMEVLGFIDLNIDPGPGRIEVRSSAQKFAFKVGPKAVAGN